MIEKTITLRKCHIGYTLWITSMVLLSIALPLNINNANTAHLEHGGVNQPHQLCYTDYFTHENKCDYGVGDGTYWEANNYAIVFMIVVANLIPILWLNYDHKWLKLNVRIESCDNDKITERSSEQ